MADKTGIQWTDATWNPVTGCDKVSQGCKHCYAELMAERLQKMGSPKYVNGFEVTLHGKEITGDAQPYRWTKPRLIFVNSMSDLFHESVPDDFIEGVFDVMRGCPQHTFQILTKRDRRLGDFGRRLRWPSNVWMGVSIENEEQKWRIAGLTLCDAQVKFLSIEPLLGPLGFVDLYGIDWVIVGGESGPDARPMKEEWATEIRDQCLEKGVKFFFKQWGGVNKKKTGRLLEGRTWDEIPGRIAA